ncbi:hypothetical protein F4802DRAFT_380406 [Xylaria palmicola]|nr:hypothetical protein F4802DRAFT_380406 [Xylaria palmicola]
MRYHGRFYILWVLFPASKAAFAPSPYLFTRRTIQPEAQRNSHVTRVPSWHPRVCSVRLYRYSTGRLSYSAGR